MFICIANYFTIIALLSAGVSLFNKIRMSHEAGKRRIGNITETDNSHSSECCLEERDLTLCKQTLVELRVAAKAVKVTNSQWEDGDGDAARWIWPNNRDGNSFCCSALYGNMQNKRDYGSTETVQSNSAHKSLRNQKGFT